jgi:hypothetical protein
LRSISLRSNVSRYWGAQLELSLRAALRRDIRGYERSSDQTLPRASTASQTTAASAIVRHQGSHFMPAGVASGDAQNCPLEWKHCRRQRLPSSTERTRSFEVILSSSGEICGKSELGRIVEPGIPESTRAMHIKSRFATNTFQCAADPQPVHVCRFTPPKSNGGGIKVALGTLQPVVMPSVTCLALRVLPSRSGSASNLPGRERLPVCFRRTTNERSRIGERKPIETM